MTKTEKRIEMAKLLTALRRDDEPPGETILRALRRLYADGQSTTDDEKQV